MGAIELEITRYQWDDPPTTIHQRLVNWGNWARVKPHYHHCASIEHRYRSPQCWYPPEPRPPEPDLFDALAVERTMRHLPQKHRESLFLRYVCRLSPEAVRRKMRVPLEDMWLLLDAARVMVINRLERG